MKPVCAYELIVQIAGLGGRKADSWVRCAYAVANVYGDAFPLLRRRADDRSIIRCVYTEQEVAVPLEETGEKFELALRKFARGFHGERYRFQFVGHISSDMEVSVAHEPQISTGDFDDADGMRAPLRTVGRQQSSKLRLFADHKTQFPGKIGSIHDGGIQAKSAHNAMNVCCISKDVSTIVW